MSDHPVPQPRITHLRDYRPPDYHIETANLQFELDEKRTRVTSLLVIRSTRDRAGGARPLVLEGRELDLKAISLDGRPLRTAEYRLSPEGLTIPDVPGRFALEVVTEINPADNTRLSGLYL